tara:strand:- start:1993 stop:3363 length:1371 start_codon:yes stop_codon:yes gene_type:complete
MATYLTRTVSDGTSNRLATFSFWVKRSCISDSDGQGSNYFFCVAGPGGFSDSDWLGCQFQSDDTLRVLTWYGGTDIRTNMVFRDPASWYHIVIRIDTTAGAAANRIRIYVNGTEQTSFSTANYPSQNHDYNCLGDSGAKHYVGCAVSGSIGSPSPYDYANGYIADFNLTSGQSYPASSFGETDSTTGEWKPKLDLSGLTYGDNGFRLKFANAGSLGADTSGQGHNLTVSGAGTNAQTTDTPSNNFATLNRLASNNTITEGSLKAVTSSGKRVGSMSSIGVSSGKWYVEYKVVNAGGSAAIGLENDNGVSFHDFDENVDWWNNSNAYAYQSDGNKRTTGVNASYGSSFTAGDIIGVALDMDNRKLYFSKNGTFQDSGDPTSGSTGTGAAFTVTDGFTYFFQFADQSSAATSIFQANFGNPTYTIASGNSDANGHGNFEYAVPSGYFALCTKNLNTYG